MGGIKRIKNVNKNNFKKTSPYFSPQQIIEFFFLLLKNEINHYLEL